MSRMLLRRDVLLRLGGRQQLLCFQTTAGEITSKKSSSSASSSTTPNESTDEGDWFNQATAGDIDERVVPKPVSVLPDHLPQLRKRQHQKPWWKFRHFVDIHTIQPDTTEYTESPQYPPIYDTSVEGVKQKIREEWYAAIRRLPSAEQKIYEITKHYGHLSYMIEPVSRLYNNLAIQQAITRTHLLKGQLPAYYTEPQEKEEQVDGRLKEALLTAISNRLSSKSRLASIHFKKSALSNLGFADEANFVQSVKEEDILADCAAIVKGFTTSTSSSLQVDYNPSVATSWWVNDCPLPFIKKNWFKDATVHDQLFTYRSDHAMHIRSETPLVQVCFCFILETFLLT